MSWGKAKYLQLAQNCFKVRDISRFQLAGGSEAASKLTLFSVPSTDVSQATDPVTMFLRSDRPSALMLQLDPLRYISRYRKLAEMMLSLGGKKVDLWEIDESVPRAIEECTVTRQNLEILAGEDGIEAKRLFKDVTNPEITEELLTVVESHVFLGECRWPYLQVALYPAILSTLPVILCDLPEVLLRTMVGNTVSIAEAREMFHHIVSDLKSHYSTHHTFRTTEESFSSHYPHIASPFTDRYLSALISASSHRYTNIGIWLGVHHAEPVIALSPHPPTLQEAVAVPGRIPGETDSDLIEKHAILEAIFGTEVWEQPYLSNQFPYLSSERLSNVDLHRAKECFADQYARYEAVLEREIEVPEGLMREMMGEMGKKG